MAEGQVDWTRLDLTFGPIKWGHLNITPRLDYYRVRPTATYVTWRPLFLGIGIDDLQRGSLDLRRADLIRLQLCMEMNWSGWNIKTAVSQLAPLSVAYHETGSTGADSGSSQGAGSGEESTGGDRGHHGFPFALSLSVNF